MYGRLSAKTLQAVFDAAFDPGYPDEKRLILEHNGLNREQPWSVRGRVSSRAATLFDLLAIILRNL